MPKEHSQLFAQAAGLVQHEADTSKANPRTVHVSPPS